MDLKTWSKQYSQTFESDGSTNLNVTSAHEEKNRQLELLTIQQRYAKERFRPAKKNLPDYLPIMLEFASNGESHVGFDLLNQYRDNIEAIKEGLKSANSFYVNLFEVISKTLEDVFETVY